MTDTDIAEAADGPELIVENFENIGRITFNRPKRRNPITAELPGLFLQALDDFDRDPNCRAVIVTGRGKAFCGGADLNSLNDPRHNEPETQYIYVRETFRLVKRMREMDLPVIAAVNGIAVGGGASIGSAADIAIAAPQAGYFFAFGRIGAMGADMGCTYSLPRHVGAMKASQLILTGATVDEEQGRDLGVFVDVVPGERLINEAQAIALRIPEQLQCGELHRFRHEPRVLVWAIGNLRRSTSWCWSASRCMDK
jgi:enoyl-CoA hydratase/carnithine racemase